MSQRALDKLNEAQHRRAIDRADFFELLVRAVVRVREQPDRIDAVVAEIRAASDRVSNSLDATDQALIDRVTAIVWKEQATRADQVAELRKEIAAGGEP